MTKEDYIEYLTKKINEKVNKPCEVHARFRDISKAAGYVLAIGFLKRSETLEEAAQAIHDQFMLMIGRHPTAKANYDPFIDGDITDGLLEVYTWIRGNFIPVN